MTPISKIALLVASVLLIIAGFWATRDAPDSAAPPPAPLKEVKGERALPKPAPSTPVRVVDSCEAAKNYLAAHFEGELSDAPLTPAELSWDAGLTWAPGPEVELSQGVFYQTPKQEASVDGRHVKVEASERIQALVALPGEAKPDLALLVWAGLDPAEAARFQPQSDALNAWKAYRKARLDLRIYRWSDAKSVYLPHQLLEGPPTCDAPFDCGDESFAPRVHLDLISSQYLLVRSSQRQGCLAQGESCETVELVTIVSLDSEERMRRLAQVPMDVYTGLNPSPLLMRNRYLSYRLRFQDHNGDGALDFTLVGHEEKLTTVDARGISRLSGVKRAMPYPIGLRYLRVDEGFVPVERTMSDIFEAPFNRALKRLSAKRLMVATAYRALSDATNILQVIAEAVAHASPRPPEALTDPTLYCLSVDHQGQGPLCKAEGLGGARALDVDVIQQRAVDMVRMWARIRSDVPADALSRLDANLNRVFQWICKAGESELAKTSPAPPPKAPAPNPNAAPPPPTPVSIGAPGGELRPPSAPPRRQTPMPTAGQPRKGSAKGGVEVKPGASAGAASTSSSESEATEP